MLGEHSVVLGWNMFRVNCMYAKLEFFMFSIRDSLFVDLLGRTNMFYNMLPDKFIIDNYRYPWWAGLNRPDLKQPTIDIEIKRMGL